MRQSLFRISVPLSIHWNKRQLRHAMGAAGVVLCFAILTIGTYLYFPLKSHWREIYYPALRAAIELRSPYDVPRFYNPPWTLLPLLPLAFLPVKVGSAVMSVATMCAFAYACYRLRASRAVMVLFLLCPTVAYNYFQVNVDWLALLGFFMPTQIGLFFLAIKPQLMGLVVPFWLWQTYRDGGIRRVAMVFGPITAAYLVSFAFFGLFYFRGFALPDYQATFLPYSIPFGLALVWAAFRKSRPSWLLPATSLLTPYTQHYTWSLSILGFLPNQAVTLALIVATWLAYVLRLIYAPDISAFFLPT